MQEKDQKSFIELLKGVHDFYGKQFSDFSVQVWVQALIQYELSEIKAAFGRHVSNTENGQFMPRPADVIKMMTGSNQNLALFAWTKVDRAVRSVGNYEDVVFDDPLIHVVISEMGGWISLGQKKEDEWPFVAKEFENRYRGYSMRNVLPEYPSVLTGLSNFNNVKGGFKQKQPVLIGNTTEGQKVMRLGMSAAPLKITRGQAVADYFNQDEVLSLGLKN